ncbi:rhomboid family intramembrane serine protease [Sphingobacterium sp. LRF_L2]|uniref:rhomboid family intramembrane serine protease n=1 Tax=Sphingobacterium sp. LRF_L2 TaxID=3369421 RepID=UPI003F5D8F25
MKENVLKAFLRDTYQGRSPIPFIISVQIFIFVLIHIFDLLQEVGAIHIPLETQTINYLSLPTSFSAFLKQPWSILSYSFLYTGLFPLLFDCLWLFWMGNTFLNFLNRRQFLFLYSSSLFIGALVYLSLGFIPVLQNTTPPLFYSAVFALSALVAAVATLVPRSEVRLFLFGNVSLRTIAIIYIALSFIFVSMVNKVAGLSVLFCVIWGIVLIRSLQQGNDFSLFFTRKRRSKLKVVHKGKMANASYTYRHQSDLPNQEEIDAILDKISVGGYDSLTSQEKEILFKASKGER